MPKKIKKTLQDYFSKIKTHHPPQIQSPFNSFSSSKSWILSGCKHPKTSSFALDGRNENHGGSSSSKNHIHKDEAATLADVDHFLLENFKSLYLKDDEEEETENNNNNTKRVLEESPAEAPKLGAMLFESPRLVRDGFMLMGMGQLPDGFGLRQVKISTLFFMKPRFSGSLVEDAMTSMTTCDDDEAGSSSTSTTTTTLNDSSLNSKDNKTLPENCIALLTYSPSPYEDFKRSMQDMVEARSSDIDWEFMEELLFCYLNLNEKKSHKFILSAFVDIIAAQRQNSESDLAKPRSVRTVRINREVKKKMKKKNKEVMLEFGSS